MDKTISSLGEAVASIRDGMTVMIGGFGGSGAPIELIHALIDRSCETGHPKALTVINNNAGNGACWYRRDDRAGNGQEDDLLLSALSRSGVFTDLYLAARSSWSWCRRERSPNASGRRRGHPGLLYADLVRDRPGKG